MVEIPHHKALVERLQDRPFALIGINTDEDKDDYWRRVDEYGVNWRSSWQGSTEGPLVEEWGISRYPTTLILDANHVIRYRDLRGAALGEAVDELLAEANG